MRVGNFEFRERSLSKKSLKGCSSLDVRVGVSFEIDTSVVVRVTLPESEVAVLIGVVVFAVVLVAPSPFVVEACESMVDDASSVLEALVALPGSPAFGASDGLP